MGLTLVPVDTAWLSDARLRETFLAHVREKVEASVQELSLSRHLSGIAKGAKVTNTGDAVMVELGTQEQAKRQAVPRGSFLQKPMNLSKLLGKHPAGRAGAGVKEAIHRAMSTSLEAVMATKDEIQADAPPRVADILGIC